MQSVLAAGWRMRLRQCGSGGFEMADRIIVSTEYLSQVARELAALRDILVETESMLEGVNTTKECGGEVKVQVSSVLVSGNTVAEVTQSLRKAVQRSADEVSQLAAGARASAGVFAEAEMDIRRQIGALQSNLVLNVFQTGGAAGLNPSIDWHSSIDAMIKAIKERMEQAAREREERRAREYQEALRADPFDDEGLYGGDQGAVKNDFKNHDRYRAIIERNTGHTFTGNEFDTYLNRMNDEGCGYIAICNSIFAAYKGDPEGFQKAFGIPMYRDGDLNYNELFVDLYSKWDNRTTSGKFKAKNDRDTSKGDPFWGYDYWSDATGKGTNINWRGDVAVQYLKDCGVNATSEVHSGTTLTADMYNSMVANGEVTQGQLQIRMSGDENNPAILYDRNGQPVKAYNGGHAMTVTGTTGSGPDAMLIVSSWGKTYYVKPSDTLNSSGGSNGNMGYMILRVQK